MIIDKSASTSALERDLLFNAQELNCLTLLCCVHSSIEDASKGWSGI